MHLLLVYIALWLDEENPHSSGATNFVGAAREIEEPTEYLWNLKTEKAISEFCSIHVQWKFTRVSSTLWRHLGGRLQEYETHF